MRASSTILAARLGARVVAVEANPACLDLIHKNVRANGCEDDVEVELALVGGSSGVFGGEGRRALGAAAPPLLGVEEIVERHGLATIDFLKIDVEGAEFDVIDEAATWLSRVSAPRSRCTPSTVTSLASCRRSRATASRSPCATRICGRSSASLRPPGTCMRGDHDARRAHSIST